MLRPSREPAREPGRAESERADGAMIQSLFIMASTGEVIIEKHWRGVTARSVCDFFWDEVNKHPNKADVPPILYTAKYYLVNVKRDDLFLIAALTTESPPLFVIEFLHRVFDIFKARRAPRAARSLRARSPRSPLPRDIRARDIRAARSWLTALPRARASRSVARAPQDYFTTVDETAIKENFSTVYQLLEEMMDNGYPLTTEPNALKAMIKPPTVTGRLATALTGQSGVSDVLPDGTISSMPWRKAGVKYAQNEIYLDVIEEVDAIVDRAGQIVSSEVSGIVHANSRLSGIPDLTLTFLDPEVIDDCSFHPCVRMNRYERDRVVSFVPPDGEFELMKYRVNTQARLSHDRERRRPRGRGRERRC